MQVISRKEAKENNLQYYFTGVACINGHVDKRLTRNSTCIQCKRGYNNTESAKAQREFYRWVGEGPTKKKLQDFNYSQTEEGKSIRRAIKAKRRAAKLQRTPEWSETEAIKEFYMSCPVGYEVDHIIPLQGELVSGLHVLSNLQYLTEHENRSKQNKFNIEEFENEL